jgi:hypothetical protein
MTQEARTGSKPQAGHPSVRRWLAIGAALVLAAFLLLAAAGMPAASLAGTPLAEGYDLSWWTVDGGGAMLSGSGGYRLAGTAGQAEAGLLVGGTYRLGGGFWGGGPLTKTYEIYLPLVMR